jgi:hypothetical protein
LLRARSSSLVVTSSTIFERALGMGGAVHVSALHRRIAVTQEIAHQETLAPDLCSAFGFRRSSRQ